MLDQILTHLRERGIQWGITILLASLTGWYGYWRARQKWQRKEYLDRINVSLNLLVDNTLLIRTLLEKSCDDIFLNKVAVSEVLKASQRTTEANPLLPLPQADYWYYLNSVLNEVSEKFAAGLIRRDLGQPVVTGRYLVALTFECAGEMKTRKVRAMVIRKDVLLGLPEETPKFTSPHHMTRWKTLHIMKAAYQKTPWQFIEMELCL